jgi:CTP:molybdopterin cytidylyltransferase MocA
MPAGLLLAAGGGSRLGRPKALVRFHGEPLARRGVRLLTGAGCRPITVVVGADGRAVAAVLRDRAVQVVVNSEWPSGMGSSVRAGLAALRRVAAPAVVIALVDQPLVAPDAVRRLIAAWRRGAVIAAATYGDRPRTPVLFDALAWDAVERVAVGDQGARALLRDRPDWVEPVPCDDVASPLDIDTEAELCALTSEPDPNPSPARAGDRAATKEQQWN